MILIPAFLMLILGVILILAAPAFGILIPLVAGSTFTLLAAPYIAFFVCVDLHYVLAGHKARVERDLEDAEENIKSHATQLERYKGEIELTTSNVISQPNENFLPVLSAKAGPANQNHNMPGLKLGTALDI